MPVSPSPYQQWCPPALTAAAAPLAEVGRLLRALSDDHAGLAALVDGSPSRVVRDAVEDFLHVYADSVYRLACTASSLAMNLRWAAEDYAAAERVLHDAFLSQGLQVHR